jgi:ABC-type uncharacterized transport system fused permease/ATPase subunit
MVAALWSLTGAVFVLTLLGAFAIPSWPVLALLVLAIVATLAHQFQPRNLVVPIALILGLAVTAYEVYRFVTIIHLSP